MASEYEFRIDESTGQIMTIDYAHHEIHAGSTFVAWGSTTDLDTNPIRIKIEVPAQDKRLHIVASLVVVGQSVLTVTENPTGGATGGTPFTPVNKRRDSPKVSIATVTTGVTAPTGGTAIIGPLNYGDRANDTGGNRDDAEWIFGKSDSVETYVIEVTSSTNAVVATLYMTWYEHTDRS